ncbi:hypothetical protein DFJ74DRAFT_654767 [Hyaloraphidium curvatum]|nr:hypothetical protein DFJ74DRAFT_654767 [Hyaloraphidium curvatum]
MAVRYPRGSWDLVSGGGTSFLARPIDVRGARGIMLEYEVYFAPDFDWFGGGRLPGLLGGPEECAKKHDGPECFSTRFMWRRNGQAEVYMRGPRWQDPEYCYLPPWSLCGDAYGDSLGRGSFALQPGRWNRLRQYVQLNSFDVDGRPVRDGVLVLWAAADGAEFPERPAIDFRKLVLRTEKASVFAGIRFETFQGGRTEDFAAPRLQRGYFRGVKLWAY